MLQACKQTHLRGSSVDGLVMIVEGTVDVLDVVSVVVEAGMRQKMFYNYIKIKIRFLQKHKA